MTVDQTANTTDEVDTSTNEEALDTEAELENDDTSFDIEDDSDETEESSESDDDESANESDEEDQEESAEDVDEDPKEEDTASEEDKRKEAARQAYLQREAARKERDEAKREAQAKYLQDAGDDPHEIALRQLQIDAYNNKVQNNINTLQNSIDKAVAHIDIFRSGTPEQKEALAEALDDFERMHVRADRNGDPIEVTGDVFDFLQRKAETIRTLASVGARQQVKDRGITRARTLTKPTRVPKKPPVDPMMEGFDEEADRW